MGSQTSPRLASLCAEETTSRYDGAIHARISLKAPSFFKRFGQTSLEAAALAQLSRHPFVQSNINPVRRQSLQDLMLTQANLKFAAHIFRPGIHHGVNLLRSTKRSHGFLGEVETFLLKTSFQTAIFNYLGFQMQVVLIPGGKITSGVNDLKLNELLHVHGNIQHNEYSMNSNLLSIRQRENWGWERFPQTAPCTSKLARRPPERSHDFSCHCPTFPKPSKWMPLSPVANFLSETWRLHTLQNINISCSTTKKSSEFDAGTPSASEPGGTWKVNCFCCCNWSSSLGTQGRPSSGAKLWVQDQCSHLADMLHWKLW